MARRKIPMSKLKLVYSRGTLLLEGAPGGPVGDYPGMLWDERTRQWRAPAHAYRDLVLSLRDRGLAYEDTARRYEKLPLTLKDAITPRPHQADALKAWLEGGRRGVVQLPTGAGKTYLALLAMVATERPTLIVVPTIDLLHQWQELLERYLARPIGALGGGVRDVRDITVSTYDSAALNADTLGDLFGLLVVDECHHLPAPQYATVALSSLAPFRLGLSATVERADGRESEIFRLLGPMAYEGKIHDMVTSVLAPYDVVSIEVPMTAEEEEAYKTARAVYVGFIKRAGINFQHGGWIEFVKRAARMPGGKEAMRAYRDQRRLAQASSTKLGQVWTILEKHRADKVIIFTDDNTMAYRIGTEFVLPVLTHQTKLKERKKMLAAFRTGELSVIVTSKVLNEGVDVPDASVGVVVSGSGGVREHVQRLGRILRHRPGKRAVLYELVSRGTSETFVNQRRKQHHAYQGPSELSR